jgi:hypothetical protein
MTMQTIEATEVNVYERRTANGRVHYRITATARCSASRWLPSDDSSRSRVRYPPGSGYR